MAEDVAEVAPGVHRLALPLGIQGIPTLSAYLLRAPAGRHAGGLRHRGGSRRRGVRRPRRGAAGVWERRRTGGAARRHPRPHRPLRPGGRGGAAQRRRPVDAPAHRTRPREVRRTRRGRRPAGADARRPRPVRARAHRLVHRAAGLDAGDALDRTADGAARRGRTPRGGRPRVGGDPHAGALTRARLPLVAGRPAPLLGGPPAAGGLTTRDVRAGLRARPDGLLPGVAGAGGAARARARAPRPRSALPRWRTSGPRHRPWEDPTARPGARAGRGRAAAPSPS